MPEKSEIIAGLKNAVERGYPLEAAIQTFINSGYNRQDVLDSAKNINEAVISKLPTESAQQPPIQTQTPQPLTQAAQPQQLAQQQPIQTQPTTQQTSKLIQQPQSQTLTTKPIQEKKKSRLGWILLLSGTLLILLVILIIFIFFKEQALSFFHKLGY